MDSVCSYVQATFLDTVSAAKTGDIEAIGWLLVIALSIVLGFIAFFQVAVGDAKVSKAKRLGKSIPPPSYNVGLPLIGNVLAFAKNPLDLVWEGYAKKGEVFTVRLLTTRLTFLIGPAACEAFFKASDTELDQSEPYKFSIPVFGKDVVYDATLENRLQHFRILSMTLRVNMLETYVPLMIKEAEDFFAKWGDEGELDLFEELGNLIILTGSRCIMGREVRENLFGEVSHLIHDLDQGMQPISVLANWLPIKAHRVRDRARKKMGELFEPIIRARRSGQNREDDMLQWLIEAKYKNGKPFTENEIVGILVAGLFGAQHTSSATSTWIGMHLLRDEAMVLRVKEEQEQVLSATGGKLNYEALTKMNLLHSCMKETLRMHPPLIFLMRKVLEPRPALGGRYIVPEGDYVVASPSVAGMLPDVFAEPNKWDPDRFLPPREEDKIAPYSFLGFGAGRHGCMGEGFAYVQVKTIWSILLKTFDMEAVGKSVPEPNYNALVVGPAHGTCIVRYKRKKSLSPAED
ncbi:cytochrome P450 family 51-CYP51G1 [Gracilaria domingensis]|nr:cytochrome P450 family 51-CYP51G1 [Gracilaria domingensis]